jgi:hypothetical protein
MEKKEEKKVIRRKNKDIVATNKKLKELNWCP